MNFIIKKDGVSFEIKDQEPSLESIRVLTQQFYSLPAGSYKLYWEVAQDDLLPIEDSEEFEAIITGISDDIPDEAICLVIMSDYVAPDFFRSTYSSDGFEKIERAESVALSEECLSQLSEKIVSMVDSKIAASLEQNLEKAVSERITAAMQQIEAKSAAADKKKAEKKAEKKAKKAKKAKKQSEANKKLETANAELLKEKANKAAKKEATKEYLKKLKAQKKDAFKKSKVYCTDETSQMSESKTCCGSKQSSQTQNLPVHDGFICDGCEIGPITGTRFKCFECGDYDLCSACEPSTHRHHIMLRIPAPENFEKLLSGTNGYVEIALDLNVPGWKPEIQETSTLPLVNRNNVKGGEILTGHAMMYALPTFFSGTENLESVSLSMKNKSKSEVNYFWINYQGNPQHFAKVPAGEQVAQQTYTTHQWFFTNENGTFGSYKPMFTREEAEALDTIEVVIHPNFSITVEHLWKSEKVTTIDVELELALSDMIDETEVVVCEAEPEITVEEVSDEEVLARIQEVVAPVEKFLALIKEVVEPVEKVEVEVLFKTEESEDYATKVKQLMEIFDRIEESLIQHVVRTNPEMALENLVVVVLTLY
jgi:hypothetical protein